MVIWFHQPFAKRSVGLQEERPGAAHLELPEDIAREETEEPVIGASYVRRPLAEHKAIRRAVELISRPIIRCC